MRGLYRRSPPYSFVSFRLPFIFVIAFMNSNISIPTIPFQRGAEIRERNRRGMAYSDSFSPVGYKDREGRPRERRERDWRDEERSFDRRGERERDEVSRIAPIPHALEAPILPVASSLPPIIYRREDDRRRDDRGDDRRRGREDRWRDDRREDRVEGKRESERGRDRDRDFVPPTYGYSQYRDFSTVKSDSRDRERRERDDRRDSRRDEGKGKYDRDYRGAYPSSPRPSSLSPSKRRSKDSQLSPPPSRSRRD